MITPALAVCLRAAIFYLGLVLERTMAYLIFFPKQKKKKKAKAETDIPMQKVAGTFKEYELTIYSDKELTDKKISFNTGNNNYDYTISFAPGKYYWITTLLFENHANCATKKYNVTLSRASSFTIKSKLDMF